MVNIATDCQKNEIFDMYSGICRKLNCQEDFMLQNNTCVPRRTTFAETQCLTMETRNQHSLP